MMREWPAAHRPRSGASHDERGFVYRTLYPSVDLMREVAEEISGKPVLHPPRFRESVVHDPELAALSPRRIGRWSVRTSRCLPAMRGS
jgi:hypothetical protein